MKIGSDERVIKNKRLLELTLQRLKRRQQASPVEEAERQQLTHTKSQQRLQRIEQLNTSTSSFPVQFSALEKKQEGTDLAKGIAPADREPPLSHRRAFLEQRQKQANSCDQPLRKLSPPVGARLEKPTPRKSERASAGEGCQFKLVR